MVWRKKERKKESESERERNRKYLLFDDDAVAVVGCCSTYHDWAALLSEVIKQLLALERDLCSRWEEEYFAGNLCGVERERERERKRDVLGLVI